MLCFVLSLSLSQIDCAMAPKQRKSTPIWNPLKVPGLLLLILPFLSTSGSVMRRPKWTFLRTSTNVAFIRNARLSCRTLLTLLYLLSFELKDRNLYLRDPQGVLSCLFRCFTPTYMASIPLYLSLLLHSEVHVL